MSDERDEHEKNLEAAQAGWGATLLRAWQIIRETFHG